MPSNNEWVRVKKSTLQDIADAIRVRKTISGSQISGDESLTIFVTAPTGCTVTAEKLDGDDEGTLYTGVESQETAGEYIIKVMEYGEYEISAIPPTGSSILAISSATITVIKPNSQLGAIVPLEYIENTGTQWIDIGLELLNGFRFTADVVFKNNQPRSDTVLFGQQGRLFGVWNGSFFGSDITTSFTAGPATLGTRYKLDVTIAENNGVVLVDGIERTKSIYASCTNLSGSLTVFKANNGDSNNTSAIIYGNLTVYDITSLTTAVSILCPAKYIGANGTINIGMYDTVRNQFFTNAGTGEFIAGPEI